MSLPFFPMYPTDFEAKTSHLSLEEDGAYNRLLRLMWMTPGCSLPDDDNWIMRRMRCDADTYERVVRVVIDEFCIRENGRVSNAKLTRVFEESNDRHQRRISAGSKGGKAKALKNKETASSNAVAKTKQPEPEPELQVRESKDSLRRLPQPVRFDEFWDLFPHRGGSKKGRKPSLAKYEAAVKRGIPESEIIDGARRYQSDAQVLRGYGKNPETWLNQECWADDIEPQFSAIHGGQYGKPPSKSDERLSAFIAGARGAS